MALKQVTPHNRWPSGDSRPIAMLALAPADLAAAFDLVFEPDEDELGDYSLAAIAFGDEQVWLVHRPASPVAGVEVHVDSAASTKFLLPWLASELGLNPAHISWSADPKFRSQAMALQRRVKGRGTRAKA